MRPRRPLANRQYALVRSDDLSSFEIFGYVVLRRFFSDEEAAEITIEVASALSSVYGDAMATNTRSDEGDDVAAPGSFLPLMANSSPLSQRLTTDDERIRDIATSILGDCVIAGPALATCLTGDTPWHNDGGTGDRWVRMNAYLTPTTASSGSLRVVPGSQHDPVRSELCRGVGERFDRTSPDGLPSVPLETTPGDLIVFDPRIHHGSWGGAARLRWSLDFVAMPSTDDADAVDRTRGLIADLSDWPTVDRWPTWSEWATGPTPSRQEAVQKLVSLGVLDRS